MVALHLKQDLLNHQVEKSTKTDLSSMPTPTVAKLTILFVVVVNLLFLLTIYVRLSMIEELKLEPMMPKGWELAYSLLNLVLVLIQMLVLKKSV